MEVVLRKMNEGDVVKRVMHTALLVFAGITALSGAIFWLVNWGEVFDKRGGEIIGGILAQLVTLIAFYAATHAQYFRAKEILRLPQGSYFVSPIAAQVIRLTGEISAIIGITGGLVSAIWMLFSNYWSPMGMFVPSGVDDVRFLAAVSAIVVGAFYGFLSILIAYFLAELVSVIFAIEANTRGSGVHRAMVESQGTVGSRAVSEAVPPKCPSCQGDVDPDWKWCQQCGDKLQ